MSPYRDLDPSAPEPPVPDLPPSPRLEAEIAAVTLAETFWLILALIVAVAGFVAGFYSFCVAGVCSAIVAHSTSSHARNLLRQLR